MGLALIGTFDLSVVTDRLLRLLRDYYDPGVFPQWLQGTPNFDIGLNGSMPESLRATPDQSHPCSLSVYLFHVRQSASQRNATVGGRTLTVPFTPLALELFYLVTAWADQDFHMEQRAMSVALRCFHDNPIVTMTHAADGVDGELTLDIQAETPDELGRVWQALATPLRFSAVYRASVVFMNPQDPPPPAPAPVQRVVVSVDRVLLFGTLSAATYLMPSSPGEEPRRLTDEKAPAVVALGATFTADGVGLLGPTSDHVWVRPLGGVEVDVTGTWLDVANSSPTQLTLAVPDDTMPGPHTIRVGNAEMAGTAHEVRSAPVPFGVAARVTAPADPVLTPSPLGVFTMSGVGFAAGRTDVLVGSTPLLAIPQGTPGVGEFVLTGSTGIDFVPPAALASGTYGVVVRVDGVQSPPACWVRRP